LGSAVGCNVQAPKKAEKRRRGGGCVMTGTMKGDVRGPKSGGGVLCRSSRGNDGKRAKKPGNGIKKKSTARREIV